MAESFDVVVAAAVVTDTGILLVQEAKGTYAGCWGLPKGHVEPNESIENAVLRELEEETNIQGKISGFLGLRTTKTQRGAGLFICYKVEPAHLEIQPPEDEIANLECSLCGMVDWARIWLADAGYCQG